MERKKTWVLVFGVVLAILLIARFAKAQGAVSVAFQGLSTSDGQVIFMIFDKEEGFPGEIAKAYEIKKAMVKDQQATATFENIACGNYVLCAIHDEDKNGAPVKDRMGIPKASVGLSGDSDGKPTFDKARFSATTEEATKTISFEPFIGK